MIERPLSCCVEKPFSRSDQAIQPSRSDHPVEDALPAGPTAFVLIARLHALPGQAEQVIALSGAVDQKVEAGELGTFANGLDRDPGDSQGSPSFGQRSENQRGVDFSFE